VKVRIKSEAEFATGKIWIRLRYEANVAKESAILHDDDDADVCDEGAVANFLLENLQSQLYPLKRLSEKWS
jgi:head-tail adaptor